MPSAAPLTVALAAVALSAVLVPATVAGADDPSSGLSGAAPGQPTTPEPSASGLVGDEPTPTGDPDTTASATTTGTPDPTGSVSTGPTDDPSPNGAPTAADDLAAVRWGATVQVDVLANDVDPNGDPLTVTGVGPAALGAADSDGAVVRYTPDGTATGTDSFTYTVDDGRGGLATATVTVTVGRRLAVRLTVPERPHALRPAQISGAVSVTEGGLPDVLLQRWATDRWVGAGPVTVRPNGTFGRGWRPTSPGPVRWRAVAQWGDADRVTSVVQRVRVVARHDPVVTRVTRRDLPHTWRPGCPVGPDQLRAVRMTYWDYDGDLRRGTLIGSTWAVDDYVAVFRAAFAGRFPIKKLYPVDRYGGSDIRAMAAGNTSAFNCRHVTGNPYRMSQHSWGDAIDINTFENPYATGSRIYPAKAAVPYYHRREHNLDDPGVITARSAIAQALFRRGWYWGARWANRDYQHWSRNGG